MELWLQLDVLVFVLFLCLLCYELLRLILIAVNSYRFVYNYNIDFAICERVWFDLNKTKWTYVNFSSLLLSLVWFWFLAFNFLIYYLMPQKYSCQCVCECVVSLSFSVCILFEAKSVIKLLSPKQLFLTCLRKVKVIENYSYTGIEKSRAQSTNK